MSFRFLKLFLFSLWKLLLDKIRNIYLQTSYYNKQLNFIHPTRSYDMNNIPLIAELLDIGNKRIDFVRKFGPHIWELDNLNKEHILQLHKFSWLPKLDLVADQDLAKKIILQWIDKYINYHVITWSPLLIANRIIFWVCCSNFTVRSNDMIYKNKVIHSIIKQSIHLEKCLDHINNKIDRIFCIIAILLSSVAFEGRQKVFQSALKNLKKETNNILDSNGFVKNKNPKDQFWLLHHLVLAKEFLSFSQNTIPEFLEDHIEMIGSQYKTILIDNHQLPLFNGSKDKNCENFNKFLKLKNYNFSKNKPSHFYLTSKTKKFEIILDSNEPPGDFYSQDYQSGCLSFELLYGGKKIITNCGYGKNFSTELGYLSQSTAAHSTVTINDTSSCLFEKNQLIRNYYGNSLTKKLKVYKRNLNSDKNTISVIAGHNGYQRNFNTLYERKIVTDENANKVSGEELLVVAKKPYFFLNYAIRFHVLPDTKLIKTQGGDILLSFDNQGWRFSSTATEAKIESSLYFGASDKMYESNCILLEGTLKDKVNTIQWFLEKN